MSYLPNDEPGPRILAAKEPFRRMLEEYQNPLPRDVFGPLSREVERVRSHLLLALCRYDRFTLLPEDFERFRREER